MKIKNIILLLSAGGVLFSGYLSAVKFFSKTCALGESCPYFWGYPACYYGFAMFTAIAILAVLWNANKIQKSTAETWIILVSIMGTAFAGYFTLQELPVLFSRGFGAYLFGLPTCALGLLFYIAVLVLAVVSIRKNNHV